MKRVLAIGSLAAIILGAGIAAWARGLPEGRRPFDGPAIRRLDRPADGTAPERRPHGPDHRGHRGLRMIHADGVALKGDGTTVDVRTQKGTIKEVSNSSITLESPDGYSQTYAIDGDTHIRVGREQSSAGSLHEGQRAMVLALKKGDGYVATKIHAMQPKDEPSEAPAA